MGAEVFTNIVIGKNANEAFTKAHDDAAWEYGHGGYTGTIAEKHGFRQFPAPALPEGVPVSAVSHLYLGDDSPEFYLRGGKRVPVPVDVWQALQPMLEVADDKWGDAVCIDITDTPEGQEIIEREMEHLRLQREQSGLFEVQGGTRVRVSPVVATTREEFADKRVFLFFGWASS